MTSEGRQPEVGPDLYREHVYHSRGGADGYMVEAGYWCVVVVDRTEDVEILIPREDWPRLRAAIDKMVALEVPLPRGNGK